MKQQHVHYLINSFVASYTQRLEKKKTLDCYSVQLVNQSKRGNQMKETRFLENKNGLRAKNIIRGEIDHRLERESVSKARHVLIQQGHNSG